MFFGDIIFALAAGLLLTAIWVNSFRKGNVWILRWLLLTAGLLISRTTWLRLSRVSLPRLEVVLPWMGLVVALAVLVPVAVPKTAGERMARARAETTVNYTVVTVFWILSSILLVALAGQWLVKR
ncbi:MAG: hypothetical protein JXA89_27485 [Anaerolineae bacterium]|nr:hypothetical protein [Anaerolineae bacterium]